MNVKMSTIKSIILKLQTNSKEVFDEVTRLLIKIADNILREPTNLKIRRLQRNNVTISKKILGINGGLDCLLVMGFEEKETYLVLPPSACLRTLQVVRDEILSYLKESKQDVEPNVFLGLIEDPSSENSFVSNHASNVDPISSDDSSDSTESENETETSNVSHGAIPKILVGIVYFIL
ncbi:hypothetical protein ILUMI_05459 [Ignelater luminosus]|uniref:PUB domain-containing protein n=1 Tax=Ignelater luminosus TaxID=2038154 RepID=A0A8K0GK30_IGNLU|nr:hypothetical protein ILUMI_05459 [Ignelater luminosus]